MFEHIIRQYLENIDENIFICEIVFKVDGCCAFNTYFIVCFTLLKCFCLFQIFVKKLKKALGKKDSNAAQRIRQNRPKYKLDHIVKERYIYLLFFLKNIGHYDIARQFRCKSMVTALHIIISSPLDGVRFVTDEAKMCINPLF